MSDEVLNGAVPGEGHYHKEEAEGQGRGAIGAMQAWTHRTRSVVKFAGSRTGSLSDPQGTIDAREDREELGGTLAEDRFIAMGAATMGTRRVADDALRL